MPSRLPLFADLRDHVLVELGLDDYVGDGGTRRRVAEGLVPEPFMLSLVRAGVRLNDWLAEVFALTAPNAVHAVLADLALSGAHVWTVNFDDGIEQAAGNRLSLSAWPDPPDAGARLLKPHGTAGGQLIVDADQVLRGLDPAWLQRLRADVAGRTVVFIGYRGRDLDFHPVWADVLKSAAEVLWFDYPVADADGLSERQRKVRLVGGAVDRLTFRDAQPDLAHGPNPSWDFVAWARRERLATVPDDLVDAIHEERKTATLPPIGVVDAFATAEVRELLGDIAGARRTYLTAILRGPHRGRGLRSLGSLTMNHGARPTATLLAFGLLVPPIGRLRLQRERLRRKRLNILYNVGDHAAVVRGTSRLRPDSVSTLRILRAAALRMTSNLDEAVDVAATSLEGALREEHRVRIANAAFQHVFALMWAGLLDQANAALVDELRPHAEIASGRWVAWTDFLTAALAIHAGDPATATQAVEDGVLRFEAEALVDGVISCKLVGLTALRLAGNPDGFRQERSVVRGLISKPAGTYYARGSRFTAEALALEEGEFNRCWEHDPREARQQFMFAAASRHDVHVALGHLGLASLDVEASEIASATSHVRRASTVAARINARGIQRAVDVVARAAASPSPGSPPEVFFP